MPGRDRAVLLVDAGINLVLGLPLVLAPGGVARWLGLPDPGSLFYAVVLGAVLCGIGLALVIECGGTRLRGGGLGPGGAMAINVCGAAAVAVWLADGASGLESRGRLLLWSVVLVVGVLSALELSLYSRRERRTPREAARRS